MYKILAVFNGIIIAFMVTVNGMLSNEVGQYLSLIIIHFIGLLVILLIFFIKQRSIVSIKNISPLLLSAGAIGILNVYFNNICFSRLGVTLTITLGLFGQLVTSYIIDHWGLLGMTIYKLKFGRVAALAIISLGIVAMLFI